jgi:fructose-specific phosphotransferase system IIC component
MDLVPVLLVVAIYGAAAYLLTTWIRATIKRWLPMVDRWLAQVEIAKRLLPCVVAFGLLAITPLSFLAALGLALADAGDFWSSAWLLAILSGIFSGYAYHWIRDVYKRRRRPPAPDDGVPPDADRP